MKASFIGYGSVGGDGGCIRVLTLKASFIGYRSVS